MPMRTLQRLGGPSAQRLLWSSHGHGRPSFPRFHGLTRQLLRMSSSSSHSNSSISPLLSGLGRVLKVAEEVADAVAGDRPVVALESTIYTHGAIGEDLMLEEIVRGHGAVPAVVGILDGVPTVGIMPGERDRMVESGTAVKASRRDLAYLIGMAAVGRKMHAGTTIAGTMLLSRLAGIRVFGTGGLGGVHQDGENSMDVSADLTELGRTRVAVVSAGPKGFLDIPRTLEFLETQGVPVATFADTNGGSVVDFPAFWARESGTPSPFVVTSEREAAAMILAQEELGIETGVLFGNPIPAEHAIPRAEMESAIRVAVAEAKSKGFVGSRNTPYVLQRIRELTGGRSVRANKVLIQANVERAAKIAVEVSRMLAERGRQRGSGGGAVGVMPSTPQFFEKKKQPTETETAAEPKTGAAVPPPPSSTTLDTHPNTLSSTADILVAGSVAVDLSCDYAGHASPTSSASSTGVAPVLHTSNPATIRQSIGGVGRNVALAAHLAARGRLRVKLCSLVGNDIAGKTILASLEQSRLDTSGVRQLDQDKHPGSRTAQYVAINDGTKDLVLAMADMGIFTLRSFPEHWDGIVAASGTRWVVVDANWSEADIDAWIRSAKAHGCRVAFEPVSVAKAQRLFPRRPATARDSMGVYPRAGIDLATPNALELAAMHDAARQNGYFDNPAWFDVIDAFNIRRGARDDFVRLTSAALTDAGVPVQSVQLLPYIPTVATKLGARGVLVTSILGRDDPRLVDRAAAPYILARALRNGPGDVGGVYMRLFPVAEEVLEGQVVSVNGVGDTFLGVLVAGLAMRGGGSGGGGMRMDEELVGVAQRAAVLTLKSAESVSREVMGLGDQLRMV